MMVLEATRPSNVTRPLIQYNITSVQDMFVLAQGDCLLPCKHLASLVVRPLLAT